MKTAATQAQVTTTIDTTSGGVVATTGAIALAASNITVNATATGAAQNGGTLSFVETAAVATPLVTYSAGDDTLIVYVNNAANTTLANLDTAFVNEGTFDLVINSGTLYTQGTDNTVTDITAGGIDAGTGLLADLVFQRSGTTGSEVFSFDTGATSAEVAAAINLVSDSTGVTATVNSNTLELDSSAYGLTAFVDVEVISAGGAGNFESGLSATRATGTDVVATVNGTTAVGKGNELSINKSALDLIASVAAGFTGLIEFDITGGGALFQLGPDVVSNQQARIGIQSVFTGNLGAVAGRLYELGTGGIKALDTDTTGAAEVVDEVITKVSELRGRLGAFQRTTLDANISALNDTLSALTEAESSIRDADFSAESAKLTRAQILVQSGVSVLSIANSNPQNILALLR